MSSIGIISEGHADRAVIENIIKGLSNVDYDFQALLPKYSEDETDKAADEHGGHNAVFDYCKDGKLITNFFNIVGNDYLIIQLDTAESQHYKVVIPEKNEDYCNVLTSSIRDELYSYIDKYNQIKNDDDTIETIFDRENVLFALAVEEIEAWILTIYFNRDTSKSAKVKEKLDSILGKLKINTTSNYENFKKISKDFTKGKNWIKHNYHMRNSSLEIFKNEVEKKL